MANVEIRITTTGGESASAVFKDLKSAVSGTTDVLERGGISTGIFGQALAALTSPVGQVTAVLGTLLTAAKLSVDAMSENARTVERLMAVSGLGAEAADNLADTFQLLGSSSEALTNALFKMGVQIDSGGKALADLGISIRDLEGNLKTEGEVFLEVRDRIAGMGSASERSAALMEIFGRAGRELAPIFALSRQEFEKWMEKASGISHWNDDLQRTTKEYQRALAELGLQWDSLLKTIGAEIVPALTNELRLINELVAAARNPITFTFNMIFNRPGAGGKGGSFLEWLTEDLIGGFDVIPGSPLGIALTAMGVNISEIGSKAVREAARKVAASWNDEWETAFSGASSDKFAAEATKVDATAKKLADAMKTHAASVGDAWDKAQVALRGFQDKLLSAAIPDSFARQMVELRAEAEKLAAANPLMAASFRAVAESIIEVESAAERGKREIKGLEEANSEANLAWKETDALLESISDELKLGSTELRTTTDLYKGLGISLGTVKFDQFVSDLQDATAALQTGIIPLKQWPSALDLLALSLDGLDLAILRDDVNHLVTSFSNLTPELLRLTKSAADAALEMAILTDSIGPLLAVAEDQRWEEIGKSIESAFLSILDTGDKLVTGLIQGTLDFADVWENLWQKIAANTVNTILHGMLEPILKEFASFTTELARMLFGGGGSPTLNLGGTILGGIFSGSSGYDFSANTGMDFTAGAGMGGGGLGTFSSLASLGTTLYSVVAKIAGLPSLLEVGLSAVGGAFGLLGGASGLASPAVAAGLGIVPLAPSAGATGALFAGASGAGITAGALAGPLAVLAIPALAGFLANMGQAHKAWLGIQRREMGAEFGTESVGLGQQVRSVADLMNNQAVRSSLALIGASVASGIAPDLELIAQHRRMAAAGEGNFDDLIAMMEGNVAQMERFMSALEALGIAPDFQRLEEGSTRPGVTGGPLIDTMNLMKFWNEIFDRLGVGLEQTADAANTAALSQTELIASFVNQTDTMRELSKVLDLGVIIPELSELTGDALDFLASATEEQLAEIIARFRSDIEAAIAAEPIKLASLLDIESLRREGETAEETFKRVAAALFGLGEMMKGLELEIDILRGKGPTIVEAVRSAQADIDARLADIAAAAATAVDPSDILALAQEAYALVKLRYELEIKAVQELMAIIQAITEQIAAAGSSIAQNAPWLAQAGVDIGAIFREMAGFTAAMPTVAAKLTGLASSAELFVAALEQGQITPADWTTLATGLVDTVRAAMAIQDPGQRLDALTTILNQVGAFLATLPQEQRDAIIAAFGPEIQAFVAEIERAAREQAEHARLAAEQLVELIRDSGALTAENFLVQQVKRIADALDLILTHAAQALETAISNALTAHGLQHGTGPMGQGGGLAFLHAGEIVANPMESYGIRGGYGHYTARGYEPYAAGAAGAGSTVVNLNVTVEGNVDDPERFTEHLVREIRHGSVGREIQRLVHAS